LAQVWQTVEDVHVVHEEGQSVQALFKEKVPGGQVRHEVMSVGLQVAQLDMHGAQESGLTLANPRLHLSTSQKKGPVVSHC